MATVRAVERVKKPNSGKTGFTDKKPLHDKIERDRLVLDNEGLVITIARRYVAVGRRFGLSFDDLKQECNRGFILAAQRWDPEKGAKFSTYAGIWARKCILEAFSNTNPLYLPKFVRGKVKALREALDVLRNDGDPSKLTKNAREEYDAMLAGKETEKEIEEKISILEYNIRRALSVGRYISLDQPMSEDGGIPHDFLVGTQETMSEEAERKDLAKRVTEAVKRLSNRERIVIEHRFLSANPLTLEEVGKMLGVSKEAVRQKQESALRILFSELKEIKTEEKCIENNIPVKPKEKVEKIVEEKPPVSTKQNNPKPVNEVVFSTEELFIKKEMESLSRFKNTQRKKLVYLESKGVPEYIIKALDLKQIDLEKLILFVSVAKKHEAFECLKTSNILNNTTSAGFEGFVKWKKAEADQRSA